VGKPNRRTTEVQQKLEALGCDPIEGMARLAMDETVELSIRAQMYKELAQYVAPKRKAIEHSDTSDVSPPPQFIIDQSGGKEGTIVPGYDWEQNGNGT
jgi:hypothetical protein